ncbi:MAG: leucyl aminopeptidase family protein [Pseudomonadota bacterium]
MTSPIVVDEGRAGAATPLYLLAPGDPLPAGAEAMANIQQFEGAPDQVAYYDGGVLIGAGDGPDPLALGAAAMKLPQGDYRLASAPEGAREDLTVLGFALGAYRFHRYLPERGPAPTLIIDSEQLAEDANGKAAAMALTRDLINTPAEDMGPDALEAAVYRLGEEFGAEVSSVSGDDLVSGFPLVHAVGRAAAIPPRLMELRWSGGSAGSFTLIGKGVCFDSGGLNIKNGKGMALMKKDMGGAGTALGLAHLIMARKLPISFRMLIPAVENAVSGSSFRPGDVFTSRAGQTVEISNTDAEGRLILADAISYAAEEKPDRIMTLATLTGAARVALGPDLPPIYSTDEDFQRAICETGMEIGDPLWPMPFWDRYNTYLRSDIADVNHAASTPFAGSITAALFLKRFCADISFTHIDTFAWNASNLPGRPKGGEALTLRAIFTTLEREFSRQSQ